LTLSFFHTIGEQKSFLRKTLLSSFLRFSPSLFRRRCGAKHLFSSLRIRSNPFLTRPTSSSPFSFPVLWDERLFSASFSKNNMTSREQEGLHLCLRRSFPSPPLYTLKCGGPREAVDEGVLFFGSLLCLLSFPPLFFFLLNQHLFFPFFPPLKKTFTSPLTKMILLSLPSFSTRTRLFGPRAAIPFARGLVLTFPLEDRDQIRDLPMKPGHLFSLFSPPFSPSSYFFFSGCCRHGGFFPSPDLDGFG